VLRVGYFGSYAQGNWGVGSDLDMVIVVQSTDQPFHRRAADWDTTDLPVPVDLLIYTAEEWQNLDRDRRFSRLLQDQTVWVYP
jgi:predicted nucleotidyltransferase